MRICIFARAFAPSIGGLERAAALLAGELQDLGHTVEVVTDVAGGDPAGESYTVTRTRASTRRYRAFKENDVVLLFNMSLPGLALAWLSGRPVVVAHHSAYAARGAREALKKCLMHFVANVSCSSYVASRISARSSVIPNAVAPEFVGKMPSRARDLRDFVFCGRLVSEKGAYLCLQAFRKVTHQVQGVTLTVIGDGPERSTLEAANQDLISEGTVVFRGELHGPDVPNTLREHLCTVVPSRCLEAFGLVALEGIACCETVIVTRRGALPEAVGPCGVVVDPSVDALAQAMCRVAVARRGGDKIPGSVDATVRTAHLAAHSARAMAEGYLSVLRACVDRRTGRAA